MPQEGEFNLKKIKAKYKIDDITLVDSSKLDSANECRLYFEIFLSIGLTFIGSILSIFNLPFLIVAIVSLAVSLFFLIRYILKEKKLKKSDLSQE